jgi:hypothetical protein
MEHYLETFSRVPLFGVLAAAIAMIVASGLWYSPMLFGRASARLSSARLGDKHARSSYAYAIVTALFTAYLLGVVSAHTNAHPHAVYGCVFALWLFVMLEQANGFIWNREPFALFLIHAFRSLFCLAVGAGIFLLWS